MAPKKKKIWTAVDRYFEDTLLPHDEALDAALRANRKARLPSIDVTPLQGKFLELLVRTSGARRILEIGTLGGYSSIWLARALPEDGRLVTLELNSKHAEVARANLKSAGLLDRVDLREGRAVDSLAQLSRESAGPFDFIFIDADKAGNPEYLQWSLKLSRPGTVIVLDNVVRDGRVIDADSTDPDIQGIRRFTEMVAAEPRLSATVLQTVADKGYDGFALLVVLSQ
jgi:predicted O-methyltransferase YrrM